MTTIGEAAIAQGVVTLEELVQTDLAPLGYVLDGIVPLAGEFTATAIKTTAGGQQFRAQALGVTREDAANALVRTITRP